MKLVIGNKNYSSWSLRAWLVLRQAEIPFEEEKISFNAPDFKARVLGYSPVGKVPVLVDGSIVVWDSLAIAEYLADKFPEKQLWPEDCAARARARSVSAEMHSGFTALRQHLTMNLELTASGVLLPVAARRDVERVLALFRDCRSAYAGLGPFLFGKFTIADAFFAPVTRRFVTYGVELPDVARAYVETIAALPAMKEWITAALSERDFVPEDEPYRERR